MSLSAQCKGYLRILVNVRFIKVYEEIFPQIHESQSTFYISFLVSQSMKKKNVFQEHYSSKYRHKMSGSHEDCSLIRRLIHKLAEFLTFSIANKKKLSPDTTCKGRERRMGHLLALLADLSRREKDADVSVDTSV